MSIAHLLPFLLNEGGSNTFYTFSNADGKRWLMPAKNMRTAMNLYQPSGIKGKGMKALFPYLYRLGVVNKAVGAEKKRYELVPELKKLLCRLFGTDDIEFSYLLRHSMRASKDNHANQQGGTHIRLCQIQ